MDKQDIYCGILNEKSELFFIIYIVNILSIFRMICNIYYIYMYIYFYLYLQTFTSIEFTKDRPYPSSPNILEV